VALPPAHEGGIVMTSRAQKALELQDRAHSAVGNIETLCGMMEVLGQQGDGVAVSPVLVANVGGMISDETMRIRELLEAMRQLVPRRKS